VHALLERRELVASRGGEPKDGATRGPGVYQLADVIDPDTTALRAERRARLPCVAKRRDFHAAGYIEGTDTEAPRGCTWVV